MALVGNERMNIVEWSQYYHNGTVLPQVQLLAQDNQWVMDMPFMECNDGTTHLYQLQTAEPTASLTALGEGDSPSKSAKASERERTAMATSLAQIEKELTAIGGAGGVIMAKEDMLHLESIRKLVQAQQIYGNYASNTKAIDGLATRYNSLTGTKSRNVISASDGSPVANAQTSVYAVKWGPHAYGLFPKGTTAGYRKEPIAPQLITLSTGKQLYVQSTRHVWHFGLCIEDWRAGGRICNIDVADANTLAGTQQSTSLNNILHQMLMLKNKMERVPGSLVFYCNDTIYTLIMRLGMVISSGVALTQPAATQFGTMPTLSYLGVPIRRADQILNTEAVVS